MNPIIRQISVVLGAALLGICLTAVVSGEAHAQIDLDITTTPLSCDPAPPYNVGDTFVCTVTVLNNGPVPTIFGYTLNVTIPPEFQLNSPTVPIESTTFLFAGDSESFELNFTYDHYETNSCATIGTQVTVGGFSDTDDTNNEDSICLDVNDPSLPVTVSYFESQRSAGTVDFSWETATQTGTAGFNLLVESGEELSAVNPALIPSEAIDSLEPLAYSYSAAVDGGIFWLEELSIEGVAERHGPYEIGKRYGISSLDVDDVDADELDRIYVPILLR